MARESWTDAKKSGRRVAVRRGWSKKNLTISVNVSGEVHLCCEAIFRNCIRSMKPDAVKAEVAGTVAAKQTAKIAAIAITECEKGIVVVSS